MGKTPVIDRRFGFASSRYEWRLTMVGLVLGVMLGLSVGGIGIAAKGSAISLPAAAVLGLLLALIGDRAGIVWDRWRTSRK